MSLSPVALQTLIRLWNQIKHGALSLQKVISPSTEDGVSWADMLEQSISTTVWSLCT
jgi:hypothetical protein